MVYLEISIGNLKLFQLETSKFKKKIYNELVVSKRAGVIQA